MLREKEKKQRVADKNGHRLPEKALYGLNGYRPSDKEPFMGERQPRSMPLPLLRVLAQPGVVVDSFCDS